MNKIFKFVKNILIIFGGLFILLFGFAMCSTDDSTSVETDSSAEVVETIEATPTPELVEEDNIYEIGETYADGDVAITLIKVNMNAKNPTGTSYLAPASGNKLISVIFRFENLGKSDRSTASSNYSCYVNNTACDYYLYTTSAKNPYPMLETISGGRSLEGCLYFEVPSDTTEAEIEYDGGWLSDKVIFIAK